MIYFIKIKSGEKVITSLLHPDQVFTYIKKEVYRSKVLMPTALYYLQGVSGGNLRLTTHANNIYFYE